MTAGTLSDRQLLLLRFGFLQIERSGDMGAAFLRVSGLLRLRWPLELALSDLLLGLKDPRIRINILIQAFPLPRALRLLVIFDEPKHVHHFLIEIHGVLVDKGIKVHTLSTSRTISLSSGS